MPSPEEFAPRASGAVMTPERMKELRDRARAVRAAQATGAPIPGTEYATTAPAVAPAPVPVQVPAQYQPTYVQPAPLPGTNPDLELARQRFKLASYYELLIAEPVFGDEIHSDPYAAQVHFEVTEWATNRLAELTGIRSNVEGFSDDEVQVLKSLAQQLGPEGVRALVFLADRVLNPPAPAAAPPAPPVQQQAPAAPPPPPAPVVEDPPQEDDEGSSAMTLSVTPPAPTAPPTAPRGGKPRVRTRRAPGAPAVTTRPPPGVEPSEQAPQKRSRKRQDDPLAAGRALVASQGSPAPAEAPAAAPAPASPAPVASAPGGATPVPMPKGMGMTMAMEAKAGEALRQAHVIETTGGGVL